VRRLLLAALLCAWVAGAIAFGSTDHAMRAPRDLVRPVALPFLWRSLADAAEKSDPAEAYECAQRLLAATPGWADGHAVFAFRYALQGGATVLDPTARAVAAKDRLLVALAVMEDARASCGPRESALLADMAWLVELAVRNEPGIAPLLDPDPAILADRLLADAESHGGGRMVREKRLYDVPRLCAALLRAGDRRSALALLDEAAVRCAQSGIEELAGEWRATLLATRTLLAGEGPANPALREQQKADPRLEALAPFLR
jgi:hypothetical protein